MRRSCSSTPFWPIIDPRLSRWPAVHPSRCRPSLPTGTQLLRLTRRLTQQVRGRYVGAAHYIPAARCVSLQKEPRVKKRVHAWVVQEEGPHDSTGSSIQTGSSPLMRLMRLGPRSPQNGKRNLGRHGLGESPPAQASSPLAVAGTALDLKPLDPEDGGKPKATSVVQVLRGYHRYIEGDRNFN